MSLGSWDVKWRGKGKGEGLDGVGGGFFFLIVLDFVCWIFVVIIAEGGRRVRVFGGRVS